jgi:hypothetical protein
VIPNPAKCGTGKRRGPNREVHGALGTARDHDVSTRITACNNGGSKSRSTQISATLTRTVGVRGRGRTGPGSRGFAFPRPA